MTRRGSIAYYMSAVVFGSLFFSASFYLYHGIVPEAFPEPMTADLLGGYLMAMVVSFFPFLIGAFVLRRVATRFRWAKMWMWIVGGTFTFWAVLRILAGLGKALATPKFSGWSAIVFSLICAGPYSLFEKPFWLQPIPGIGTAYVLFVVCRAFDLKAPLSSSDRAV